MPRTKLGDLYSRPAPLDPAVGMILARKQQSGKSLKALAAETGCGYDRLRHFWNKPPLEWPAKEREAILKALGLKQELVISER